MDDIVFFRSLENKIFSISAEKSLNMQNCQDMLWTDYIIKLINNNYNPSNIFPRTHHITHHIPSPFWTHRFSQSEFGHGHRARVQGRCPRTRSRPCTLALNWAHISGTQCLDKAPFRARAGVLVLEHQVCTQSYIQYIKLLFTQVTIALMFERNLAYFSSELIQGR